MTVTWMMTTTTRKGGSTITFCTTTMMICVTFAPQNLALALFGRTTGTMMITAGTALRLRSLSTMPTSRPLLNSCALKVSVQAPQKRYNLPLWEGQNYYANVKCSPVSECAVPHCNQPPIILKRCCVCKQKQECCAQYLCLLGSIHYLAVRPPFVDQRNQELYKCMEHQSMKPYKAAPQQPAVGNCSGTPLKSA